MRRAIAFASRSLAAPLTLISAVKVAPSPSATIWPARSAQTARRHSSNVASLAAERVAPPAPFASRTTVSFVEHSPSTEMALKLSSTAARRNSWASPASSG